VSVATINIQLKDRGFAMLIELDPQVPSDKPIIGFLQAGRLYEPDIAEVMMRAIVPGDVMLDIGANAGFFTLLMGLLTGRNGRVVSFEPASDNLVRLRHNIGLNGLASVTIVDRPAAHVAETIDFHLNSDNSGGHSIWDPGRFPGNERSRASPRVVRMLATTVDAELARLGLPPPKLIKIDTEGAEHSVLQGARGLLADHKVPYVITELHDFGLEAMGTSQQGLRDYMQSFGYDTFALYQDGVLPKLIPPGTRITSRYFMNLLFSTPADVAKLWPHEEFDAVLRGASAG
jgi:FkbM family methyltransferase